MTIFTIEAAEDFSDLTPVEYGEKLYTEKTCNTCHSLDGSSKVGPTFKGLFGKLREFEKANSVTCDENYLRESILNSNEKVVKGYPAAMPAFQGLLKEEEIDALIAFIKAQTGTEAGGK